MKKIGKKLTSTVLALCMAVGLVGCGCGSDGGSDTGTPMTKEEKAKMATEGVYSVQDLNILDGEDFNMLSVNVANDRISILVTQYRDEGQLIKLVTTKLDGSDPKVMDLMNENMTANEYDDNGYTSNTYGNGAIAADGTVYAVRNYYHEAYGYYGDEDYYYGEDDDLAWEEAEEEPAPMDEENSDLDDEYNGEEDHYPEYDEDYNDDYYENDESESKTYLAAWDASGKLLFDEEMDGIGYNSLTETNRYINACFADENGLVIITGGDKWELLSYDKTGKSNGFKPMKIDEKYTYSVDRMIPMPDGKLLFTVWDDEWTKLSAMVYDIKADRLEKEAQIPATVASSGFYNSFPGNLTDVIYSANNSIYTLNIGDAEPVKMMDFINSDLSASNMSFIYAIDADHILASYYDDVDWLSHVAIFTKVPAEEVVQKEVITMAGLYMTYDSNLKKRVIDFNKSNPKYRITLKDYSEYNTQDDYEAGINRLNSDIAAGHWPDILKIADGIPVDSYSKKGLFYNIDELIANDPELSKADFMENVFEAYRVDGKLYRIVPTFSVNTLIAKKSLVGDVKSITIEEAERIVKEKMADGASMFGDYATRESFIINFLNYCGSEYIDLETGKCDFETQAFKDFLNYAKSLPVEFNYEGYDDTYWMAQQTQYRDNKTLFNSIYLGYLSDTKYYINAIMGEDVAYVGFPSAANGGAYISSFGEEYAIAAKSEYVDSAWEFLRYYLTDEYQGSENRNGCSVIKKYVKEDLAKATERNVWVGDDGTEYDYDTIWLNGEEVHYDPLSKAQADALFDYLCSVKNLSYMNSEVQNIIMEEAGAFFNNQKSVEDVISIIQSRVKIYVSENS